MSLHNILMWRLEKNASGRLISIEHLNMQFRTYKAYFLGELCKNLTRLLDLIFPLP